MEENSSYLKFSYAGEIADDALAVVAKERSGEQLGLYTDLELLNRSMGKYFRFNTVNLWAGLSGHGKSYMLNQLNRSFLDLNLNGGFGFKVVVLQFCFEMSAVNEILRACAADLGMSYSTLLSSQYDKESKGYNTLSDEDFARVTNFLNHYKSKNIIFIENSGNVGMIYNTVKHIVTGMKGKNPAINFKFVVNIDHTLLIDKLGERDLLELMLNTGKLAIQLRKHFECMVNLVGQLNNNIESVPRITNKALHYPQKSDIYAQGQIYNACDNVYVIHQPQLLKIAEYGMLKYPTKDLIHLSKLKSRHGIVGNIWLKDNLSEGKIISADLSNSEKTDDKDEQLAHLPVIK